MSQVNISGLAKLVLVHAGVLGCRAVEPARALRLDENAARRIDRDAGLDVLRHTRRVLEIVLVDVPFSPLSAGDVHIRVDKCNDPDMYRSASGTLLYEMVHAINQDGYVDQKDKDLFGQGVAARGYTKCATLAKNNQSPTRGLVSRLPTGGSFRAMGSERTAY